MDSDNRLDMPARYDFQQSQNEIITIIEQIKLSNIGLGPLDPSFENILETFDRIVEHDRLKRFAKDRLSREATAIAIVRGRECDDAGCLSHRMSRIDRAELETSLGLEHGGPTFQCDRWPSSFNVPLEPFLDDWTWNTGTPVEMRLCADLVNQALTRPWLCLLTVKVSEERAPHSERLGGTALVNFLYCLWRRRVWPGNAWVKSLADLFRGFENNALRGRLIFLFIVHRSDSARYLRADLPKNVHYESIREPVCRQDIDNWEKELSKDLAGLATYNLDAKIVCNILRGRLFSEPGSEFPLENARNVLREVLHAFQISGERAA